MTRGRPEATFGAMSQPLRPVVVSRLEPAGPDAWTLYFPRFAAFRPGQVVALSILAQGPQRLYSLATGSDEDEMGVLFNRAPDGWLTPQLAAVKPGHQIYCSDPFGSFIGQPGPAVWVANGTGVAPFLSMVRSGLVDEKQLVQGARTRSLFYGQDRLEAALGDRYVRCCSAEPGPGLVFGRLTAHLEGQSWPGDRPFYLCGSAAMIVEARDILIRRGVPFRHILSEVYF